MKTLVVDDSPIIQRIIISALSDMEDAEVVTAGNGEDAVAAVNENEFDMILMDWNMPRMSGIDALRYIRLMGISTPVIMVTTESEKENIIEAIKSGANNYIIKPFEPHVIAEKIRETLERVKQD